MIHTFALLFAGIAAISGIAGFYAKTEGGSKIGAFSAVLFLVAAAAVLALGRWFL